MTTWKFINAADAENLGWTVWGGEGMLLGEGRGGELTVIQIQDDGKWAIDEYDADAQWMTSFRDLGTRLIEGLVGNVELMARCVTLKHLELVTFGEIEYADDDDIIALYDEYDGELAEEHIKVLDAAASALTPCVVNIDLAAEDEARYRIAAYAVERAGVAGTFMACAW